MLSADGKAVAMLPRDLHEGTREENEQLRAESSWHLDPLASLHGGRTIAPFFLYVRRQTALTVSPARPMVHSQTHQTLAERFDIVARYLERLLEAGAESIPA